MYVWCIDGTGSNIKTRSPPVRSLPWGRAQNDAQHQGLNGGRGVQAGANLVADNVSAGWCNCNCFEPKKKCVQKHMVHIFWTFYTVFVFVSPMSFFVIQCRAGERRPMVWTKPKRHAETSSLLAYMTIPPTPSCKFGTNHRSKKTTVSSTQKSKMCRTYSEILDRTVISCHLLIICCFNTWIFKMSQQNHPMRSPYGAFLASKEGNKNLQLHFQVSLNRFQDGRCVQLQHTSTNATPPTCLRHVHGRLCGRRRQGGHRRGDPQLGLGGHEAPAGSKASEKNGKNMEQLDVVRLMYICIHVSIYADLVNLVTEVMISCVILWLLCCRIAVTASKKPC